MNCMTSFFQSGLLDTKYNENEQTIPHDGTGYQHMSCSNTNFKTKHCLVVFPEKGRYTTNLQLNLTPNPSGIDMFFGEKKHLEATNPWIHGVTYLPANLHIFQWPTAYRQLEDLQIKSFTLRKFQHQENIMAHCLEAPYDHICFSWSKGWVSIVKWFVCLTKARIFHHPLMISVPSLHPWKINMEPEKSLFFKGTWSSIHLHCYVPS